jgi:hypothetical protein
LVTPRRVVVAVRVSGECSPDGVECGDVVGGGGVEIAADAAPAGEGCQSVPVAGASRQVLQPHFGVLAEGSMPSGNVPGTVRA